MSEREPITAELREWMRDCCYPHNTDEDGNTVAPTWEGVCDRCDAIDAVHAGLERENAELRERVAELDKRDDSMHIGGSITDELRSWAVGNSLRAGMSLRTVRDQALAIADRIDAEHEAKVSYWQGASYKDGYDEGFASADDWLAQHEDAMAEHGWVRGPLDKDGKLWRSGDMSDSNWGEIEGIVYENGRWLVSGHDTSAPWIPADSIGHYQPPTVEDVLRDMHAELDEVTALYVGEAIDSDERDRDEARIFAEYAAKLRLAGSDAE